MDGNDFPSTQSSSEYPVIQSNDKSIYFTSLIWIVALVIAAAGCTHESAKPDLESTLASSTPTHERLEILAAFPAGSFLENLEVQSDGRVLFTNYFSKTIEMLSPTGEVSQFANLSMFPVSLISVESGYLVAGQTKNFMSGDSDNPQQFLLLDKNGAPVDQFFAPETLFLNGMIVLDNGDILVADSVGATIWQVDVDQKKVVPWLQHPSLANDPSQPGFPGANGLKLHSKGLLVSNTAQGALYLIPLNDNGAAAGEPSVLAETGIIDDFWVNDDDSVIFTTHSDALKYLASNGAITDIVSEGCNGCTAIAPYPAGQSNTFVFINDGGFFFGEKNQSTVVRVSVN